MHMRRTGGNQIEKWKGNEDVRKRKTKTNIHICIVIIANNRFLALRTDLCDDIAHNQSNSCTNSALLKCSLIGLSCTILSSNIYDCMVGNIL